MNQELNKFFRWKCFNGLKKLKLETPEYIKRLEYELGVIEKMGFATYFLVCCDFLAWARENGIYTGPGRGSVAGSLIAYALRITDIDPIKYDLYFERFLNPDRISMPDIDLDYQDDRRDEVIEYARQKYKHVAGISTFGTMKCRGAIKAAARTLGADYTIGDVLSKLTPTPINGVAPKLTKCYEQVEILDTHHKNLNNMEGKVLRLADQIEDRIDKAGVHASGWVIGDRPLHEIIPLTVRKEVLASEWDMNEIEKIGLIKFDFLGLTALTVISKTLVLIKERHGKIIDLSDIPDYDEEVFKRLQAGDNIGIFQVETSGGMRDLMVKMKVTSISDLGLLTAIYRPGPLCISGDANILYNIYIAPDGHKNYQYFKLKDLYDKFDNSKSKTIKCLDLKTNKLITTKIKNIVKSGIKPVYKLMIQTGLDATQVKYMLSNGQARRKTSHLKATEDHRFLTLDGWKKLKDIKSFEYICINHHSGFGRKVSTNKYIKGTKNFRNIAFRHYVYCCCFCDWDKGSLDVNHIDGNRHTNNEPENLSFLCPNHHRMYSEGRITPEELIEARKKYILPYNEEIMYVRFLGTEFAGEEETYDIEVEDENHNFIADDYIVHNSADYLHVWLDARSGHGKAQYLHPSLEPILSPTDGFLVYQEQCMKMAVDLAGYTAAEADSLRKAIGKKLPEEMAKHEGKFLPGLIKSGFTEAQAHKLWDDLKGFAAYSFNKAHAIAYGKLAYQTSWLKTHYTQEYMCALLTCNMNDVDQVIKYIFDCREHNIKVLPPDINISSMDFTIDKIGNIRFGLAAVKNLGEDIVKSIIKARGNIPFKDLADFISRVDITKVNKRKLESLVLAGAFDFSGHTRASMIDVIEQSIDYRKDIKAYESKLQTYNKKIEAWKVRNEQIKNAEISGQKTKLKPLQEPKRPEELKKPSISSLPEIAEKELLAYEKELLGFFVSGHPVEKYSALIASDPSLSTVEKIKTIGHNGAIVNVIAIPTSLNERTTKSSGKKMASMILEDLTANVTATAFPQTWADIELFVKSNEPLLFKCKVAVQDAGDTGTITELFIQSVSTLKHIGNNKATIEIQIPAMSDKVKKLHELLNKYSGDETKVKVNITCQDGTKIGLSRTFTIRSQNAFLIEMQKEMI